MRGSFESGVSSKVRPSKKPPPFQLVGNGWSGFDGEYRKYSKVMRRFMPKEKFNALTMQKLVPDLAGRIWDMEDHFGVRFSRDLRFETPH